MYNSSAFAPFCFHKILDRAVHERRVDRAGADAVDPDAFRRVVRRERLGQLRDGALRAPVQMAPASPINDWSLPMITMEPPLSSMAGTAA